MNNKLRSSLIVLALVGAISIIKLVFFFLSKSLAVWSEVWHSLSDCATTALVVTTFWLKMKSERLTAAPEEPLSRWHRFLRFCGRPKFEYLVSLLIAAVLTVVSLSILYQSIWGTRFIVNNPVVSGIGFIVLSAISYFIYRYEGLTAESEESSALKADSLHNRADMLVSLMTGITLILYKLGINLDRYCGGLIALFIFSFAIEMVVNTIRNLRSKGTSQPIQLSFGFMLSYLFSAACWRRLGAFISQKFIHSAKARAFFARLGKIFKVSFRVAGWSLLIGGIGYYVSTAFYMVDAYEEALLFHFGALQNSEDIIGPGLHAKWPWPIDRVEKFNTRRIMKISLGFDEVSESKIKKARLWSIDHGDSLQFVTGDNNLFLPTLSLEYHIKNLHQYSLKQSSAEKLLRDMGMQLATGLFAQRDFYAIALYGRSQWTDELVAQLQKEADAINLGIEIDCLAVSGLHPPAVISTSFERVVAAYQEKETAVNLAELTKNTDLAASRVTAYKKISGAQSDHDSLLARNEGESRSYILQAEEFAKDPDIISRYKKLETAETVLNKKELYLIDRRTNISGNVIYYDIFGKSAK